MWFKLDRLREENLISFGDVDPDDEEYGMVIMKVIEENGEQLFSTLDTEEEEIEIYEKFMERLFDEEEE